MFGKYKVCLKIYLSVLFVVSLLYQFHTGFQWPRMLLSSSLMTVAFFLLDL